MLEQSIVMDSGTARASENIVMDSGTARGSDSIVTDSGAARASDDRADQGVMRMDQEEGISEEEQARRRLRSKQSAQQTLTDDETVSKRLKREATIATIKQEVLKTVAERPELEHAHEFYSSIRTVRSPESIHASRMVEINKWRERGVVERWSRQAAMATGGQMFNARWVDEQHKEKSRYVPGVSQIVGKSQGKCKNNALGKMAVFGPFFGPWMAIACQKRSPSF